MSKKVGIVDTLTLTKDGRIYGHFNKTAEQFFSILSSNTEVAIIGGKTYCSYFEKQNIIRLPFFTTKDEFDSKNKIIKYIIRIKSIINTLFSLASDCDVLIFQDANQTVLYTLLKYIPVQKDVYLIKYSVEKRNKTNIAYAKIKDKISGIITSIEDVGNFYGTRYLIIPDYFPIETQKVEVEKKYDFAVLGTGMLYKDYEDVVNCFKNRSERVLIAGHFSDLERFQKLKAISTANITLRNEYLSDSEYIECICSTKYILLPYKPEGYEEKSSGVVLDAVYRGVPVVTTDLKSFQFIKNSGIGYVYKGSLSSVIDEIDSLNAEDFKETLTQFTDEQMKKGLRIPHFLKLMN